MKPIYTYYLIYETSNILNQKVYRGKHITSNLNDGYLGSGIHLDNAISKYGSEQFVREILFMAFSSDDLSWVEENIFVTLDWIKSKGKLCYNKKIGGTGGWRVIENGTEKHIMNTASAKDNKKKTCQKKYGVDHQFLSDDLQTQLRDIFIEKYGVDNPLKSPIIQQKIKDTVMSRYGVTNVSLVPEIQDKIKKGQAAFFANGGKCSIVGKKCYYNPNNTTEIEYFYKVNSPIGWVLGNPLLHNRSTYHNPVTGEVKRFPNDKIPQGWKLGKK